MKLTVIGTGSKGNCYLLTANNGETLIIEAGVHIQRIKQALNFQLNKVVGCIMTHEHRDHSRAHMQLMDAGIDVYTSSKTHEYFNPTKSTTFMHRRKNFPIDGELQLGEFRVLAFDVRHDAVDPSGFLIYHKECGKVLFLTDTYLCPYSFAGLNNVIIEANFSHELIKQKYGDTDLDFLKDRIFQSHMSLETCCKTLAANDLKNCNNIVLIHLSDMNSHEEEFKNTVAKLTGKNVTVASNGMIIDFNKTPF